MPAPEFAPKFRNGIWTPIGLHRWCQHCHQMTMAVNISGDFSYRCYNPACPNKHQKEYVQCFLQLRNYEVGAMRLVLGDYVKLKFDEDTGTVGPDFDHKVFDAVQERGPYQDCGGNLTWGVDDKLSDFNWLRCNQCGAEHRVAVLIEYGVGGEVMRHQNYMWRKRDGFREVVSAGSFEAKDVKNGFKVCDKNLINSVLWIDRIRVGDDELHINKEEVH